MVGVVPECAKEKRKQTSLKIYGTENPMQSEEIQKKVKNTVREKYGCDYVIENKEIRKKIKRTMMKNYGVECNLSFPEIIEKIKHTKIKRYSKELNFEGYQKLQQKISNSFVKKYGFDKRGLANPEIRKKYKQTLFDNYEVNNPMQDENIAALSGRTWSKRYGLNAGDGYVDVQNKFKKTMNLNFGCDYPVQNESIRLKMYQTKKDNNSYSKSMGEDIIYKQLCDLFGVEDVLRQYKSDSYPFRCDFYIKSREMYIEFNGLWTHGNDFYNNTSKQNEILSEWITKSKNSVYYKSAIATWTVSDVNKRNYARKNKLNYVVFWDNKLRDFKLWCAMGCPIGHDYDKKYTWLYKK